MISAFLIISSETNGDDSDATNGRQLEQCIHNHDKRHHEVDGPQCIGADTSSNENAINDGEKKETDASQHRRDDIFQKIVCSCAMHGPPHPHASCIMRLP